MKKLVPFGVDAVLVIVFCAIGRRSHDEAVLAGMLRTVWPFGTGLVLGWVIAIAVAGREGAGAAKPFDGRAVWPTGVIVWLSTLIVGMLLRVVSGQGIAFSFIIVAATALALFLLGWRVAMKALR
ncbi:DUF3054 family protein [Nocardia sp. SYP-A9097]|uniref:DUF3054 domain-containing protein n=1 Tax=Nocardia sp. SYP-A9097 TaxID=2663237 RepID=UPI00132401D0|nr:DUF3054 domain-containing protein [Nocardia sp. SYP-A9097]MRH86514.1 DUF3054 family protein [Nocardia sp. SYP-A9097]